ncbi:hypothetical protein FRB96_002719 [Tulasnella sp. 330]|nr:hypothetical protein FRB96_002719 [Tulasnella sp. 330]KAG8880850.1 hypothetical protein FRB98_004703 [Tulasnella sp. 332]
MEFLSFSGKKSEDVTEFLQNVTRIAFKEGKSRDDNWLADYVESCLTGPALDWYAQLGTDSQRNWTSLRIALLQNYTARRDTSFIPAPPAAAPPGTGLRQPPLAYGYPDKHRLSLLVCPGLVLTSSYPGEKASLSPRNFTSLARVMVVRGDHEMLGYVPPPLPNARSTIQIKREDALVLEVPLLQPSERPVTLLRIANPGKTTEVSHPFYGLQLHGNTCWIHRACDRGLDNKLSNGRAQALTMTHDKAEAAASRVWSIHPVGGWMEELRAQWTEDDGTQISLQAVKRASGQVSVGLRAIESLDTVYPSEPSFNTVTPLELLDEKKTNWDGGVTEIDPGALLIVECRPQL